MSRNAEVIRELRAKAVAAGFCQMCRCRAQKPGCKTCQECLDRGKATRKRLRSEGRCGCGAEANGKYYCERCRKAVNRANARLVARAIENGKCRRCRKPNANATRGLTHCNDCIAKQAGSSAKWRRANVAAGLCACGGKRTRGFKRASTAVNTDARTTR